MADPVTASIAGARAALGGLGWYLGRPAKRLDHRLTIKADIDAHLHVPPAGAVDAIVRNQWRLDSYPNDDHLPWLGSPSAWHKAEIIDVYEAGLECCIGFPRVSIKKGIARDHENGEKICAVARDPDRCGRPGGETAERAAPLRERARGHVEGRARWLR